MWMWMCGSTSRDIDKTRLHPLTTRYHLDPHMTTQTPPAPPSERVQRLRSLPTIREQCYKAFDIVEQQGRGDYFDYHPENMDKVVEYCLKIIQVRD